MATPSHLLLSKAIEKFNSKIPKTNKLTNKPEVYSKGEINKFITAI